MYNCLERPPKWSLKRGYFTYFMKSCDIFKVVSNSVTVKSEKVTYLMSLMYPPNTHLKLSVCYFQCFYFYFNRVVTNSYRPIF